MTEPRDTDGPRGPEGPESGIGRPGHPCPECGAQRTAGGAPSCGCGPRVAEALRDARTADAAAVEDFDPLRIRPYVELDGDPGETMPLRAVPPGTAAPVEATAALPTPLASAATAPSARDLSLFESAAPVRGPGGPAVPAGGGGRRRAVVLGAGAAVVAVAAAAGLASGLFAYGTPARDAAEPREVRAGIPAASAGEAVPATPAAASPPASATPSVSGSAPESPSPTPSASESESSASPSPSASTEPSSTPSTVRATGEAETPPVRDPTAPPALGRGDRGPDVVELELRLTQLGLYGRQPRGTYNEGVEDAVMRYQWTRGIRPDDYGVYDAETRQRLESETTAP